MSEQEQPIFVHGMWRTCSSYFWSKFRKHKELRCYYEPLHEALVMMSQANLSCPDAEHYRQLRHPVEKDHNNIEFPVLEDGSIPGLKDHLPYRPFYSAPEKTILTCMPILKGCALMRESMASGRCFSRTAQSYVRSGCPASFPVRIFIF